MSVKDNHEKCCPGCGNDHALYVTGTVEVKLCSDGGTDQRGDVEWDGDSTMYCSSCGHSADASYFEWDSDHPHWPDDDDDDDHDYDHDCECDVCTEYRNSIEEVEIDDETTQPQGRIGLVHEHTLDQYRRAIEASGVLKSIDTTEGE